MLVQDILADAAEILGRCDDLTIFRRLTDAVHLANTQIMDDPNVGQLELCVCNGCVTLPAHVGQVLKCNQGGRPTVLRDQWFAYMVGGPGITDWVPWGYTDEVGRVSTYRDPSGPVKLVAKVESAVDSNKSLRVYGWAGGKRIYTPGAGGMLEDGIPVPTVYGYALPHPTAPAIDQIDYVTKDVTNGFVQLFAVDPVTGAIHTQIGYYLPWETAPSYRRVRVPDRTWLRVKYSKTDIEVRGIKDWINIDNREALMLLLKAVKYRRENQFQVALSAETEGIRLLRQDKKANAPPALHTMQVINNDFPYGNETLIY